jgi:hypothetical protein
LPSGPMSMSRSILRSRKLHGRTRCRLMSVARRLVRRLRPMCTQRRDIVPSLQRGALVHRSQRAEVVRVVEGGSPRHHPPLRRSPQGHTLVPSRRFQPALRDLGGLTDDANGRRHRGRARAYVFRMWRASPPSRRAGGAGHQPNGHRRELGLRERPLARDLNQQDAVGQRPLPRPREPSVENASVPIQLG